MVPLRKSIKVWYSKAQLTLNAKPQTLTKVWGRFRVQGSRQQLQKFTGIAASGLLFIVPEPRHPQTMIPEPQYSLVSAVTITCSYTATSEETNNAHTHRHVAGMKTDSYSVVDEDMAL